MEGLFVIAESDEETMTFTTTEPEINNGKGLALNLSHGRGVIDRAIVRFGEGTLQIFDALGRQLFAKELPTAAGVYVLRLINGDNAKTQKIVIQ